MRFCHICHVRTWRATNIRFPKTAKISNTTNSIKYKYIITRLNSKLHYISVRYFIWRWTEKAGTSSTADRGLFPRVTLEKHHQPVTHACTGTSGASRISRKRGRWPVRGRGLLRQLRFKILYVEMKDSGPSGGGGACRAGPLDPPMCMAPERNLAYKRYPW